MPIISVGGIVFLFILEIVFGLWFGGLVTEVWADGVVAGIISAVFGLLYNAVGAIISTSYPEYAVFVTAMAGGPAYIITFTILLHLVQNRKR